MGRYKSVLMAEADAKAFPHHVDVPVPGNGLGKQMDRMAAWLNSEFGAGWKSHGARPKGIHVARYMFRSRMDAELFEDAWKAGTFSSQPQD